MPELSDRGDVCEHLDVLESLQLSTSLFLPHKHVHKDWHLSGHVRDGQNSSLMNANFSVLLKKILPNPKQYPQGTLPALLVLVSHGVLDSEINRVKRGGVSQFHCQWLLPHSTSCLFSCHMYLRYILGEKELHSFYQKESQGVRALDKLTIVGSKN